MSSLLDKYRLLLTDGNHNGFSVNELLREVNHSFSLPHLPDPSPKNKTPHSKPSTVSHFSFHDTC